MELNEYASVSQDTQDDCIKGSNSFHPHQDEWVSEEDKLADNEGKDNEGGNEHIIENASAISTDPETEHFRVYANYDPHLIVFKAMYFLGMGASASYYPFLVLRFFCFL